MKEKASFKIINEIHAERNSHVTVNLFVSPKEERVPHKGPPDKSLQTRLKPIYLVSAWAFILIAAALYMAQQSGDGYLLVSLAKVILEFMHNVFLE